MATKKSILVPGAVALCALAVGGLALTNQESGAHASAAASTSTPVPGAPSPSVATSSTPSAPTDSPTPTTGPPTNAPTRPSDPAPNTPVPQQKATGTPSAPGVDRTAPAPLSPAQLPDSTAAAWKPIAQPHTQPVTHDVRLNECAAMKGASNWQQQGYVSSFHTPAVQDTFTFADAAAAEHAYGDVTAAMNTCQQQSRALQSASKLTPDAVVTTTATTTAGTAYARQWTAVAGMSAPGAQTGHVYVVRQGNALTVLQFAIPADTPGDHRLAAADEQTTLNNLAAQLGTSPAAG